MKLIPDWRRAWRWFSVQAAGALAVLSFLQAQVLPQWQWAIPERWWPWVSAGFGTAIVLLRVVAQAEPEAKP
jgi:hypothetical protein